MISGSPVYAFVSSTPLYENLSTSLTSGTDATNVATLQRALRSAGYYTGSIDGDFGTSTATALEDWQDAMGLSVTGTLDITQFVWVPKGAVLSEWSVSLGSAVSQSTALATASYPRQLEAQASVGQSDISSLKEGQKAQLTIDGHTGTIMGTISSISESSSSSSSGTTSSSSTASYTVTVHLPKIPSYAKEGMAGSLAVTIKQRKNVLVVPTTAIVGGSSTSYVRVLMNGKLAYRQVETGMATASSTEITSGVAVGEKVVTGTVSSTSSASSSQSSGGSLLGGSSGGAGAGGGNFPAGGGPAGGQ
jgi:peptidoglycan hydrolase-like protein with peptidoglycan-binding domain